MLPCRPVPQSQELFASWLMRTAAANGVGINVLTQLLWAKYIRQAIPDYWCRPSWYPRLDAHLDASEHKYLPLVMALATGIQVQKLDSLRIWAEPHIYWTHLLLPMCGAVNESQRNAVGARFSETVNQYCPACLASGFYLRRPWRVACLCYCPLHHRPLLDRCPRCQCGLEFWDEGLASRHTNSDKQRLYCQRCHFDLIADGVESLTKEAEDLLCLITSLLEGQIQFEWRQQPQRQSSEICRSFHKAVRAVFQTTRRLDGVLESKPTRSGVAAASYLNQDCHTRFSQLKLTCEFLQNLGSRTKPSTWHEILWRRRLDVQSRANLVEAMQVLVPIFRAHATDPCLDRSQPDVLNV